MANKMTKKDYFKMAIAESTNSELIAFFNHELELLEKKNSGTRKETATQKANADLKNQILEVMASDTRYTVTEIDKMINVGSINKTNALVKQLKDDGSIIRSVEKGKAYFTKA